MLAAFVQGMVERVGDNQSLIQEAVEFIELPEITVEKLIEEMCDAATSPPESGSRL